MTKAPRPADRFRRYLARGVLLTSSLWLGAAALACTVPPTSHPDVVPGSIVAEDSVQAWYADLTTRYPHGVLGDTAEPTRLHVLTPSTSTACGEHVALKPPFVFEDVAPRLFDVTGDGKPEVITIRSHENLGGQLVIYAIEPLRLLAETPHIGTRFRWLAPAGIGDLDGDGNVEIAFVDRPHLAKTLRIWRYTKDRFSEIASLRAVTNHRIGEDYISGGLRTCAGAPELILADAQWLRILAVRFQNETLIKTDIGPFKGRASMDQALTCSY